MTISMSQDSVLKTLNQSILSGALAPQAVEKGQHLADRLASPVRVAVLGMKDAGKSTVMNLLAGANIVPEQSDMPSIELSWASQSRTVVTLDDGTIETHDGLIADQFSGGRAVFLQMQTDLPALKTYSLLEIASGTSPDSRQAAIEQAVTWADINLWCSQSFTDLEHALWDRVPDEMKDHSFFVLSKADELALHDNFADELSEIHALVADEFYSLIPVATLQAIAATGPDGVVNDAVYEASGGRALINEIMHQVQAGRRADWDSVLVFLNRYDVETSTQELAGMFGSPDAANQASIGGGKTKVDAKNDLHTNDLCASALERFGELAAELSKVPDISEPAATSGILQNCMQTAHEIEDIFAEARSQDPSFLDLQEYVMEAAEVALLMQLENGESAAADSVTLMVQLKRDIEVAIAA